MTWFESVLADCAKEVHADFNRTRSVVPVRGELRHIGEPSFSDSPDEVWTVLEEFAGRGWITTVDEAGDWNGTRLSSLPICADLVDGQQSLALRHGERGWRIDVVERIEGKKEHLIYFEKFARIPNGTLTYEVAWQYDDARDVPRWRPWLARLAKFEAADKTVAR